MGLRVDRVLYQQLEQLCVMEKLRPGEAVEALMRVALKSKTVAGISLDQAKQENTVHLFDDALFRSRLARLRKSLELEDNVLKETGELPEEPDSEYLVTELTQLGRRSISKELVLEFETCLSRADKLYQDAEKPSIEREIKRHIRQIGFIFRTRARERGRSYLRQDLGDYEFTLQEIDERARTARKVVFNKVALSTTSLV